MGRPNKYPDQFRKDALELVKTSHRPRGVRLRRSPARSGSRTARCGTGSERPVMPTLEPPIQMLCRNPSLRSCAGSAGRTSSCAPTRRFFGGRLRISPERR